MAEGCKDPSLYKDCFKVHVECLRYLTVPSLAVAPSFDILVTSAGVNYPTVDTGDPALWLLYTLLIAPWARAPWEHHLLSNICRLSIFSSQKSPSACARSLPPSPGWCISSNGQKSGKLHVFYGHIISVNLRRGTHLLPDGNIDNVKARTRAEREREKQRDPLGGGVKHSGNSDLAFSCLRIIRIIPMW